MKVDELRQRLAGRLPELRDLKVAELYVQQFGHLAKTNNTMIVPSNLSDVASVVASAMTVLERTKAGAQQS